MLLGLFVSVLFVLFSFERQRMNEDSEKEIFCLLMDPCNALTHTHTNELCPHALLQQQLKKALVLTILSQGIAPPLEPDIACALSYSSHVHAKSLAPNPLSQGATCLSFPCSGCCAQGKSRREHFDYHHALHSRKFVSRSQGCLWDCSPSQPGLRCTALPAASPQG